MRSQTSKTRKNGELKLIAGGSALISIIITPWLNTDSMIIPKLILVLCLAMFLFPKVVISINRFDTRLKKLALSLAILTMIYLLIVVIVSSAPLEQQIYGRTGRGLGLLTQLSLLIILLAVIVFISVENLILILFFLTLSYFISSLYAISQNFGFDIFLWNTKTNGIIGTLGNPNFQASFSAMALVPALVILYRNKFGWIYSLVGLVFISYVIYICESTQGYIIASISLLFFTLNYLWFKKRVLFGVIVALNIPILILTILGTLNRGPFGSLLYKPSVTSRGEFWRSAFNTANDNPLGVGLDSFADYYLLYRDEKAANGIGEFTDNAHNFFLEQAATGGYFLSILNLLLIILVLISFIKLQVQSNCFDRKLSSVFAAWLAFQLQSLISPGSISTMLWNAIFSGSLIGLAGKVKSITEKNTIGSESYAYSKPFSYFLVFLGALVTFPLFNTDRLQLLANEQRNAIEAVRLASSFPESTLRYSRVGGGLLESNLPDQALTVARAAVKFNPNAVSAWALILANQTAPLEERKNAANEIMRLDPYNKLVKNLKF